jgi:hypothetical protein
VHLVEISISIKQELKWINALINDPVHPTEISIFFLNRNQDELVHLVLQQILQKLSLYHPFYHYPIYSSLCHFASVENLKIDNHLDHLLSSL